MRAKKTGMTEIPEDWEPSADGIAYAESRGLDVADEREGFKFHHGAHGTKMKSWDLAWMLWCRNAKNWGRARSKPVETLPLLRIVAEHDPNDDWGIGAWVRGLPDTEADTMNGAPIRTLGGFDVAASAVLICEAAGLPKEWRGPLDAIAGWLREGLDPDAVADAIKTSSRHPDKPGAWAYYQKRVLERAAPEKRRA